MIIIGAALHIVGSSANGFGSDTCDIDFSIIVGRDSDVSHSVANRLLLHICYRSTYIIYYTLSITGLAANLNLLELPSRYYDYYYY